MVARRPRYPPAASAEIPGNSLERGFPNDQDTIATGIASVNACTLSNTRGFLGPSWGRLLLPGSPCGVSGRLWLATAARPARLVLSGAPTEAL